MARWKPYNIIKGLPNNLIQIHFITLQGINYNVITDMGTRQYLSVVCMATIQNFLVARRHVVMTNNAHFTIFILKMKTTQHITQCHTASTRAINADAPPRYRKEDR